MGKLEDYAEGDSADEGGQGVDAYNGPEGVEEHGDHKGDAEENDFASDEDGEVFAFGAGNFVAPDFAYGHVLEIIVEVPFDGEEAIKHPEIDALEAVKAQAFLMGRGGRGCRH